jgi:hypothetical protein
MALVNPANEASGLGIDPCSNPNTFSPRFAKCQQADAPIDPTPITMTSNACAIGNYWRSTQQRQPLKHSNQRREPIIFDQARILSFNELKGQNTPK